MKNLSLFLLSFVCFGALAKVITFTTPNEVAYSCTGKKCKVCISGNESFAPTEPIPMPGDPPKEKNEYVNQVCSAPFTDGPTMKKAANFMNSFAGRMEKSGIKVPREGFDFSQFVNSEKSKLCVSAKKLIADMEIELRTYRETAQTVDCVSSSAKIKDKEVSSPNTQTAD